MPVLYNDVHMDSKNSQEYKSFDIYVVTIKISMTEYRYLINSLAHGLFWHYSLWGKWGGFFQVTCIFSLFEALNNAIEVQFFQGFIFHTISKIW